MPPWIWPSTSVGLIARPTSCAATMSQHLHRAELDVDLDLGDLRGEGVGGVGHALAVRVERRGRRVEACPRPAATPAVGATRSRDARRRRAPRACRPRATSVARSRHSASGIGQPQDTCGAGRAPASSAALPETKVWREAEVLPASAVRSVSPTTSANAATGRPSASAAICVRMVLRALADVDRAAVERQRAVRRERRRAWSRGSTARCCRCRTTCSRCRRRAARPLPCALKRRDSRQRRCQCGRSASRHCGQAGRVREHLAGGGGVAGARARCGGGTPAGRCRACRPARPSAPRGRWRACGTPKPRKAPAGGPLVKKARAARAHVAARSRARWRAPARGWRRSGPTRRRRRCRRSAVARRRPAAGPRRRSRTCARDARRMALGGGGHALRPRVDAGDRPAESARPPAPAAAAPTGRACRRSRRRRRSARCAPAPGASRMTTRDLVAVHVGRLRRDMDLDAVADPPRPAGLGLDVGVLDEGGLEHRPRRRRRSRRRPRPASPRRTPPSSRRLPGLSACTSGASGAMRGVDARPPAAAASRSIGSSASQIARTASRAPTSASTASPRIAHDAVGQHRLVLDVGIDAEAVRAARRRPSARARGQDALRTTAARSPEAKRARRMRRAHDAQPQRIGRDGVGAEALARPSTLASRRPCASARADRRAGRAAAAGESHGAPHPARHRRSCW